MMIHELFDASNIRYDKTLVPNKRVKSVTCNSKKTDKDSIFVAIKGQSHDGNAFIPEAAKKGALIITDSAKIKPNGNLWVQVPSARRAYALLVQNLLGRPADHMKMIGVTGTNGKTTCAYLIHALLSKKRNGGLMGTVDYRYDDKVVPATHTTPDASVLHALFYDMKKAGCEFVVMEASSHALDQERLAGIRFDSALFTNLTRDHLDYHHTPEAYLQAKGKLFDLVKDNGTMILNADDDSFGTLSKKATKLISYGLKNGDLKVRVREANIHGTQFDILYQTNVVNFETRLIGEHNLYNIAGSVAVALSCGMELKELASQLKAFPGVPGRLERVSQGQNFYLFVDYAHTPDGLENVLKSVKPFVKKKLLVLFGCGGERDRGKRPLMARIAEQYADSVVVTSDNPRHEDEKVIIEDILKGFSASFNATDIQRDRRKAIRRILMMAQKDDVVVLAGKGHEDYQVLGDEKVHFSDKEEAEKCLKGD